MKQNKPLSRERAVVLGALREGPACGSQVIHRLEAQSENPFRGREGMLYPVLHGLERSKLLRAQYQNTGSGCKRWFYQLSSKGRRLLEAEGGEPTPPTDWNASDEAKGPEDPAIPAPEDLEILLHPAWEEYREPDDASLDYIQWSELALKKLRFTPCFRRVRNELANHVSDRISLLRQGRLQSYDEAMNQVIPLMGDPKELGQQLQKLHKPWLGRLQRLLSLLLLPLLLALLVAFVNDSSAFSGLRIQSIKHVLQEHTGMASERDGDYVIAERPWSCADTVQFGPFQVDCPAVLCCIQNDFVNDEYIAGYYTTERYYIVLRFTAAPWHSPSQLDDLVSYTYNSEAVMGMDADTEPKVFRPKNLNIYRINPFQTIVILRPDSIYRDPEWIEAALGRGDEKQTLRIELGPWELCPNNYPRLKDEEAAFWYFYDLQVSSTVKPSRLTDKSERSFRPTEADAGGITAAVPWAMLTRSDEDSQNYTTVDCVLELKGDASSFPLFNKDVYSRLRLTTLGTDETELEYLIFFTRHWYDTACFLHLRWDRVEGAEGYALRYETEEGGPVCTLRLEPEKEAAP